MEIPVKNILKSDFSIYGRYTDLLHPQGPYIGKEPVRFFRDLMPLSGNETLSLSITEITPMPLTVDVMEFHTGTGEGFLTLDGDTYICVAPATAEAKLTEEMLEAFFVPAGTAVYLHPGVWHYAPYPVGKAVLHTLVILPERTYARDCVKYELKTAPRLRV